MAGADWWPDRDPPTRWCWAPAGTPRRMLPVAPPASKARRAWAALTTLCQKGAACTRRAPPA
eukprot:5900745-Alexandrium_andersonii.AAC.1